MTSYSAIEEKYDAILANIRALVEDVAEFCLPEDDRMDKLHQVTFRNRDAADDELTRLYINLVVQVLVRAAGELRRRETDVSRRSPRDM